MTEIRGFQVNKDGTYVLLDDVISSIREYAQSLDSPDAGALIHELATWISGGEPEIEDQIRGLEPRPSQIVEKVAFEVYGAEADDITTSVARVEIFPDPPDDPKPKWYARSVDTSGFILKTSNGSFDFEWVVKNAEERWPGIPLHLLKNAGEDSKWVEDSTRGVFPSQGPPIRRLWAGVTGG
jgi:hypothetical protein